ncbi:MAG: LamG domain-containing protein, partial [bacterium]
MNLLAQIDPGTENLTHSWTFDDGTANDHINGIQGTLMGSAKISQGALNTTKSDSWLSLPADSIAINTYEAVTIEAWFQSVPDGNQNYCMLVSFGNTTNTLGSDYYFMTPVNLNGNCRTAISCGTTSEPWNAESGVTGPVAYDDGIVHHLVSTMDADSIKFYIDGGLIGSSPMDENNSLTLLSNAYAYLAKSVYDADTPWRGYILEFNMYNKALSADNVLFLFNQGNEFFHEITDASKP